MKSAPTGLRVAVAILENDPLRRVGFQEVLGACAKFEIVGTSAGDTENRASILLLGCRAGSNMAESIRERIAECPYVSVLVVGPADDEEAVLEALSAGAKGYVSETAAAEQLIAAVETLAQGAVWAPGAVLSRLIDRVSRPPVAAPQPENRRAFTRREQQVLAMLTEGLGNKEIGALLGIEERTVKAHVAQLMRKMGAPNRTALAVRGVQDGLVNST